MTPAQIKEMEELAEAYDITPTFHKGIKRSECYVRGYTAAMKKAEVLERVLSERCVIDDCGFDVESETIETLRDCMKALDKESREALQKWRGE